MSSITTKEAIFSLAKMMATIVGLSHLLSVGFGAVRNRARSYIDATFTEIVEPDGSVNVELLTRLAEALGLTFEQLANGETQHVIETFEKYMDFFENHIKFNEISKAGCKLPDVAELKLAYGLKDFKENAEPITFKKIQNRMLEELALIDDDVVDKKDGCNFIEIAYIGSKKLCEFEGIVPMMECYLGMIERVKVLFDKALHGELTQDELTEYNILVTATGAKDPYYRPIGLYYGTLQKLKPLYLSEGFTSEQLLFREDLEPWRVVEFSQNPELAERYLKTLPQSNKYLRYFCKAVSNFRCYFRWVEIEQDELWDTPSLDKEPNPYDDKQTEFIKFDLPKSLEEQLGQAEAISFLVDLSHNHPPVTIEANAEAMRLRHNALA